MERLNSRLEAEGAEYFVLGALLVEGIAAYKSYARMPGYDLVDIDPEKNRLARIQVKSRWATDHDGGFLVKNFECDFIVLVALNRGFRYGKARGDQSSVEGEKAPAFYVFPTNVVRRALYSKSKWGKAVLRLIDNVERYKEDRTSIKDFLASSRNGSAENTL
jgi:hypothetical protein